MKSTTVQTDDYLDLLEPAELICTPRAVPEEHLNKGHVTLAIVFPRATTPDEAAISHLEARLRTPGAVLSFGVDTLLNHPSLSASGSCVTHVPDRDPFFGVLSVERKGSDLFLEVSPTSPAAAFSYLSFSLEHDPDAAREVARRRSLGLWTGRELPVTFQETIANYGVNWNG